MLHCSTLLKFIDFYNAEGIILYSKPNVEACEGQSVNAIRLSLITGSGIVGKYAYGGITLILGEFCEQIIREVYFQ